MRVGNILFSAVHFFVIFLIFAVGAMFLALPYADYFRIQLINLLLHPAENCLMIGGGIMGFGALLFTLLYVMNRRRFFQLEMKGAKIEIEEKVIRDSVSTYFKELFPEDDPIKNVVVKGKSMVELFLSLPHEKEEEFYEQVEEELGALLARRLGYHSPFSVTFVENYK